MVYYTNCCCFEAKTGAKIIAILGIVFSALYVLFGSIFYGVYYDTLHGYQMREQLGPLGPYIDAIFGVSVVIYLKWISFCALLLHGINEKKKDFLLPWMIFEMIGLVLVTIGVFASVIMTIKYVTYVPIVLLYYLFYALILAFGFYCWDVVYSVYRDLKKEENETAMPMKFTNEA